MRLPIITVPNPKLREVSQPITKLDPKTIQLINDLTDTLKNSDTPGVGISAIQTGYAKRLIIVGFPEDLNLPVKKWHKLNPIYTAVLNPEIVAHSSELSLGNDKQDSQMEGCLSVPKVWGHVWRYTWIDLRYSALKHPINLPGGGQKRQRLDSPGVIEENTVNEQVTTRFSGFSARVLQHELDHLNGILFTDHLLGKSPIPGFKPLKAHLNEMFFDVDDTLTPIPNPQVFAHW